MREEAISSNQTWYIPQCRSNGQFDAIQCKTMTWGEKVCHCVHPKSGESLGNVNPNKYGTPSAATSCKGMNSCLTLLLTLYKHCIKQLSYICFIIFI